MYTISLLCNIQILRERPHVSPQPQPQPPSLQASKLLRSLTAMRSGDSRRRPTKIWFDLICVHMIWYDFMWFHMIWWSYINDMKLFEPKKTSWNGWHSCSFGYAKKIGIFREWKSSQQSVHIYHHDPALNHPCTGQVFPCCWWSAAQGALKVRICHATSKTVRTE